MEEGLSQADVPAHFCDTLEVAPSHPGAPEEPPFTVERLRTELRASWTANSRCKLSVLVCNYRGFEP